MAKKKIVIALGGNALGDTPQRQLASVKKAAEIIADLVAEGNDIVVGHGNGPQVGMINEAMDYSACGKPHTPAIPLAECDAMSQGYIGYHLQQALQQSLSSRKIDQEVVSLVTQVVVDQNDPAFQNPTKPVGRFYTRQEAEAIQQEKGFRFIEDAGRGYRRVVPSPKPCRIVELNAIRKMVENKMIVITVGGGGIPVVQAGKDYRGIDAVIDKDMSCSKLAQDMDADTLLILTAVDHVCLNYNKPDEKELPSMTLEQAVKYIKEGQFAAGSMLPKVEACMNFVRLCPSHTAIISSLEKADEALRGKSGTVISSWEKINKHLFQQKEVSVGLT
ncbi:carbamate kinase [Caproicibacter fermentans]|uniref:Carbamate kinase n=1 Tax=Caproicibacter fermentans TaxID=2576756 RepID=A0A7G8TAL7_9FIRM|nr:carbamate kinase [Caproicibacter fermentans]QNK40658.1 carbamate kinase [Caproicibacter fermentans]